MVYNSGDLLLEAPNWTVDGMALLLNGAGKLWRLDVTADPAKDQSDDPVANNSRLEHVPIAGVADVNNDHVLSPNGVDIYITSNDGHIYRAAIAGGTAFRITEDDGYAHCLHGVSPDGAELAYVGIKDHDFSHPGRLMTVPASGGRTTQIEIKGHCDGPEYSPDGAWLYFNTEAFTDGSGHAQLARRRTMKEETEHGMPDALSIERVLNSCTVDWFPHISPDGRFASYIQFPGGTLGHPANQPITVVLVSTTDWSTPLHKWALFGGQGTLNVNSWSPDSTRFAFIAYPMSTSPQES